MTAPGAPTPPGRRVANGDIHEVYCFGMDGNEHTSVTEHPGIANAGGIRGCLLPAHQRED